MDKDPTSSSGGSGKNDGEGRNRQARNTASTSSSSSQVNYFDQIDPQLLDALYASPNNRGNQSQPTGTSTTAHAPSTMPSFDPYMIAHAAALSALASAPQQFQSFPGSQGDNRDPTALMRAMYGSLTPALAPTGQAQGGPSASGGQPSMASFPWIPQTTPPVHPQLQPLAAQGQASSSKPPRATATTSTSSRNMFAQAEAGPSQPRGRKQSLPAPQTPATPTAEDPDQPADESAIVEDKRRRNTAASGVSYSLS